MERVRLPLPPHTKSLNRIILNASHSYRKPVNLIFPAFDTGRYMVDGELEKYKIDQKQRYLKRHDTLQINRILHSYASYVMHLESFNLY